MAELAHLPFPVLDALPCGAHRLVMLTDQALYEACGVRVAFAGRDGGVSTGPYASLNTGDNTDDDPNAVEHNRQLVCQAFDAGQAPMISPRQVHGIQFVDIDDEAEAKQVAHRARQGADGVVVRTGGVSALMNSADCLCFAVVSPTGSFALAHAGWRGAIEHIAAKAVQELESCDAAPASEYNAYLGPHIRTGCFEVSYELAQRFRDEFGDGALSDARHVSLAASVTADLVSAGLLIERIVDSRICTQCNSDRYFSYRATQGMCGRHATFAYREPR